MGRHTTKLDGNGQKSDRKRSREQDTSAEIEIDIGAHEPLSKKALRKAQKGDASQTAGQHQDALTHSGHEPNSVIRDDQGKQPSKSRDHTTGSTVGVWVGNLPWTVMKADLRTFFTQHPEIEDRHITRIHLPGPSRASAGYMQQGRKVCNKGFAYVDFQEQAHVDAALTLSDSLLGERRVLIKDANNFEGRPDKLIKSRVDEQSSNGNPPSTRVFIGNLGFDVTPEDIQKHFERCGPISQLHMATFQDTGKCKGYGWVEFTDLNAAKAAFRGWVLHEDVSGTEQETSPVSKDGDNEPSKRPKPRKWWVNQLFGRALRVEFAEPKDVRYKKRFGQERPTQEVEAAPRAFDRETRLWKDGTDHHHPPARSPLESVRSQNVQSRNTRSAASRATGVTVKSKGTKTQLA